MRVVSYYLPSGGIASWISDRDYVLVEAFAMVEAVLTFEGLLYSEFVTRVVNNPDKVLTDFMLLLPATGGAPNVRRALNFVVLKGQPIFIQASQSPSFAQILLEELRDANATD